MRHLEMHAAALHRLPIDAVDQRTIADRLGRIPIASGTVTANRVRATMSAMFTWGMREGLAFTNPVANTNKRAERPRDRVLKDPELQLLWQALNGGQYATIIKLLMLTAQRVNEIAGLRWSEIDFDRGAISFSPSGRRMRGHMKYQWPLPFEPCSRRSRRSMAAT